MGYIREISIKMNFFFPTEDDDDERKALKAKLSAFISSEVIKPGVASATYNAPTRGDGITKVKISIKGDETVSNLSVESRVLNALESGTFSDYYIAGSFHAATILKAG